MNQHKHSRRAIEIYLFDAFFSLEKKDKNLILVFFLKKCATFYIFQFVDYIEFHNNKLR